jgi:hypothetical protein
MPDETTSHLFRHSFTHILPYSLAHLLIDSSTHWLHPSCFFSYKFLPFTQVVPILPDFLGIRSMLPLTLRALFFAEVEQNQNIEYSF